MNYDEFKEAFIKSFEDYINENYSNYVINTESVLKNNITLDGLSLRREGNKIAPVVYLNYLHEDYISGKEIKDLVEHISQMMIDSITNKNDLVKDVSMSDFTYDYCKDKIVFNICNSQLNQDILDKRPNRAFNDLSIVSKFFFSCSTTDSKCFFRSSILNIALCIINTLLIPKGLV